MPAITNSIQLLRSANGNLAIEAVFEPIACSLGTVLRADVVAAVQASVMTFLNIADSKTRAQFLAAAMMDAPAANACWNKCVHTHAAAVGCLFPRWSGWAITAWRVFVSVVYVG